MQRQHLYNQGQTVNSTTDKERPIQANVTQHKQVVNVIFHDACWDLTTIPKHRCYQSDPTQKI